MVGALLPAHGATQRRRAAQLGRLRAYLERPRDVSIPGGGIRRDRGTAGRRRQAAFVFIAAGHARPAAIPAAATRPAAAAAAARALRAAAAVPPRPLQCSPPPAGFGVRDSGIGKDPLIGPSRYLPIPARPDPRSPPHRVLTCSDLVPGRPIRSSTSAGGWICRCGTDRRHVTTVLRRGGSARSQVFSDRSKSVLLYKCWPLDVFTGPPDYPAQEIGDCTAPASGTATIRRCRRSTPTSAVIASPPAADPSDSVPNPTMLRGRQDGWAAGQSGRRCFGSAVGRAMTHIGIVPYSSIGGVLFVPRAKEWGRIGDALRRPGGRGGGPEAASAMLSCSIPPTRCSRRLQAGKPCTICTRHGSTMERMRMASASVAGEPGTLHVRGQSAIVPNRRAS